MTLINTGNLGIGTASPAGKLSVVKVGGLDDIITLADDSTSLSIGTDSDLPAFMRIRPTKGTGIAITNNGDNVGLFVKSDAATNVGIGTSAPDSKLHIKSNGSTLSTNAFRVQNASSAQLFVVRDDGRIGIGLGSPAAKLHIKAAGSGATGVTVRIQNASSKELFTIKDDGKVGIGLTVPTSELDVVGDAHFNTANTTDCDLRLQTSVTNMGWFAGGGTNRLALYNYATSTTLMEVLGNGNIGIGTTNAVYKLDVCGTIRGKEVRVETGWCDYVFNQDYKLPALNEVEEFIKVNKHLPDVTPGNIIETEGLEVGKMSAQMIKKIEELTLYVIQLSKQNNSLQQQIEELKNK